MTNTTNNTYDWTLIIARATLEGTQEFATTILHSDGLDDTQLKQDSSEYETRYKRALALAKQHRQDPGPNFLSFVRNWSRFHAIKLSRAKQAGGKIRHDYLHVFDTNLKEEIDNQITQIKLAWEAEDQRQQQHAQQQQQQAEAALRAKREQAFQEDHPHVLNAYSALERAYTGREQAVDAGYRKAFEFAGQLETRMERHEQFLEHMGTEVLGVIKDARQQQKREDNVAFATKVVRGGRDTLGCLFVFLLLGLGVFFGIFFLLTFAFHH